MATSAPPVLSCFPDYYLILVAKSKASEGLAQDPSNHHLLVSSEKDEPGLAIGMHTYDSQNMTLASIGRRGCSITFCALGQDLSRVQCTFHIHPDSGEILFKDQSTAKSSRVSRYDDAMDTKSFEFRGELRQVVVHREFNDFISFGGARKDMYKFKLVWNPKFSPRSVRAQFPRLLNPATPLAERTTLLIRSEEEAESVRRTLRVQQKHRGNLEVRYHLTSNTEVGSGGYGTVFPALDVDSGDEIAVKKFRNEGLETYAEAQWRIQEEARVTALLDNVSSILAAPFLFSPFSELICK